METNLPSLALKEKVLLWLAHVEADRPAEPGLASTQAGIAHGTSMSRAHVSRTVSPLISDGLVTTQKVRVSGISRTLVAYQLAPPGKRVVDDLERSLAAVAVRVVGAAGELETVTIEVLRGRSGTSLWRILAEAADHGWIDTQQSGAAITRGSRFLVEAPDAPSERLFVGRERELAEFAQWAKGGGGRIGVVEGAPGIGKSTFLAHGIRLQPPKAHVLWIRLLEWTTPDTLLRSLSEMLSRAGRPGPTPASDALESALAMLSARARGVPFFLVLDDVQNASPVLRALVKGLVSFARQHASFRLVLAGRQVNIPGETFSDVLVLRLYPLDEQAATKVAEQLGTPRGAAAELVRATGGHPLFIELASRARGHEVPGVDLAGYLDGVILPSLDADQREVLQYAAVLRIGMTPKLLDALGVGSSAAVGGLHQFGLLARRNDGAYEAHDLVRATVEGGMGFKTRAHVHARLADVFHPRGQDAVFVSEFLHHLVRAGKREEAARWVFENQDTLMERARGLFQPAQ